jgi:hypothetical protein
MGNFSYEETITSEEEISIVFPLKKRVFEYLNEVIISTNCKNASHKAIVVIR